MTKKFRAPKEARAWLDAQFDEARVRSPFVQAVIDRAYLEFIELWKEELPEQYDQIKERVRRKSIGKQGEEYAFTINELNYFMKKKMRRREDGHD